MLLTAKITRVARSIRPVLIAPKPQDLCSVIFAITYLCNSKCTMCNIWQKYRNDSDHFRNELTIDEIRKHLGHSKLLKDIKILGIAGGEPFLKKDFVDIVLFFYELNPSLLTCIPSNGQQPALIEKKLKTIQHNLKARGLNNFELKLGLSLDGIGDTHDNMRGVKGSYQRVVATAERIKKIEGISMEFSFTFTPANYKEFVPVNNLAQRLEIPVGFQFAQISHHLYDNQEKKFLWSDEQLLEVKNFLISTGHWNNKPDGSRVDRLLDSRQFFNEYLLEYQKHPHRSFNCYSGTHSCYLDPYGNVFPCIMLGKAYGNIRAKDFDSLWYSPEANSIRDSIAQRKCHCPSPCDIPASLERNLSVFTWNLKNAWAHRTRK